MFSRYMGHVPLVQNSFMWYRHRWLSALLVVMKYVPIARRQLDCFVSDNVSDRVKLVFVPQ